MKRVGLATALVVLLVSACGSEPERPRTIVVIGIDGADFRVMGHFSERTPNLNALVERGASSRLRTGYDSKSPVVWNTIATGVEPARHGITDFVVPTEQGDVPVSSEVRRVPALWNMVSAVGGRAGVLAWWATWPAQEIGDGVVISDRIGRGLDREFWPPALEPRVDEWRRRADELPNPFPPSQRAKLDHLVTVATEQLLREESWDLLLTYFKSVDVIGHSYWKYFQPERFGPIDPDEMAAYADYLPRAYEAVDRAVGRIVEAAGPETNVFVVSDHGFYGLKREKIRVVLDLDRLLERLGYLSTSDGGVDLAASSFYTHATPSYRLVKKMRWSLEGRDPGGTVAPGDIEALRGELAERLGRLQYESGSPVFSVRDASAEEAGAGADFIIEVSNRSPTSTLRDGDREIRGIVEVDRISGSHGGGTHGIFIAAGPDIDPNANLDGIDIHDVAPTVVYGLGLPVARDFAGKPYRQLYTADFRTRFPLKAIDSWGSRASDDAPASEADVELIEELRALGYLD